VNDEQAVRAAGASLLGELGAAFRQAIAQIHTDDATARRSSDERTSIRLNQIDRRLEEISTRLTLPSSSAGTKSRRLHSFFPASTTAVTVIAFVVALMLAGAIGGKLVGDRAYAEGRAAGYAQAATFERDHSAQWRAYQRSTVALRRR
jgi:hypothetical protein